MVSPSKNVTLNFLICIMASQPMSYTHACIGASKLYTCMHTGQQAIFLLYLIIRTETESIACMLYFSAPKTACYMGNP